MTAVVALRGQLVDGRVPRRRRRRTGELRAPVTPRSRRCRPRRLVSLPARRRRRRRLGWIGRPLADKLNRVPSLGRASLQRYRPLQAGLRRRPRRRWFSVTLAAVRPKRSELPCLHSSSAFLPISDAFRLTNVVQRFPPSTDRRIDCHQALSRPALAARTRGGSVHRLRFRRPVLRRSLRAGVSDVDRFQFMNGENRFITTDSVLLSVYVVSAAQAAAAVADGFSTRSAFTTRLFYQLAFDDQTDSDVRRNWDRRLTVRQLKQASARVLVGATVQHNYTNQPSPLHYCYCYYN